MDGACPYGIVQCGVQDADHGGVDASHRSLHGVTLTQKLPIRESSKNKKERWQENGYQQQNSTKPAFLEAATPVERFRYCLKSGLAEGTGILYWN